jgi:hypothetical protein
MRRIGPRNSLPSSRLPDSIESGSDDLSSGSSDVNDESWDDWVEDPSPCRSLFEDLELPSVELALKHDREKYSFDLNQTLQRLGQLPSNPLSAI